MKEEVPYSGEMNSHGPGKLHKLRSSLPWLVRYPFWRANQFIRQISSTDAPAHLIILVANHFEPAWNPSSLPMDWDTQLARVDRWAGLARKIGEAVRDHDGTPFRHTYFYPAEQYNRRLLERIAAIQAENLGEVEIHFHHGVERPDTAENTRRVLENFRDALAQEHKCLSRVSKGAPPMYAFVHGNWALANSANGRFCGVDSEMQILAQTGCYADFTLPSAPDVSQVPRINAIYQCGRPLSEQTPHKSGPTLKVGEGATLPVILTGPLVLDWGRRNNGLPIPRIDNGALTANYALDSARLARWRGARITVSGRPEWIFIKLYCHGFFDQDQPAMIGDDMQRFLEEALGEAERAGRFTIHFATAREAFNIAMAAVDGQSGEPGLYRDYRLQTIMSSSP
jgi:hypothetical protein